jgi:kynurenine formamidase
MKRPSLAPGLALVLAAGLAAAQAPPRRAAFDLARATTVDLTHTYDDKALYWPGSPSAFELKRLHHGPTPGGYFYSANSVCTPEHGGTHLDAPIHFAEGRPSADQVPLASLIAPAVVIDVAAKAAADRDYRLSLEDVRAWEGRHGRIPEGAMVLLRTGWSRRWPDRVAYFGDASTTDASRLHFPSYGVEAARLLAETRRVGALGVDTASIDHGPSTDFMVHRVVNGAGVPGFENLAHLEQVPETGAWVVALPMKIGGGSGGPLRAVALLPGR